MNITPLIIIYLCVGFGCAITLRATQGSKATPLDLVLLLALWPLFGPFVLTREGAHETVARPPPITPHPGSEPDDDLLDALRRAGGGPLAALLPDPEAGRQLALRLRLAQQHVTDIDHLFTQEKYDERAALSRQRELRQLGDDRSASMIDNRLQIIRRLGRMRDRFVQEIHQIGELLTQLQIQAEIIRIAGTTNSDTHDRIAELVSRIQGLEDVMTEEDALQREIEGLSIT